MIPATLVPCPLSSWAAVPLLMQLMPLTAFRSELLRSIPVSSTATPTPLEAWTWLSVAAPIRRRPTGSVSPGASADQPAAVKVTSGWT